MRPPASPITEPAPDARKGVASAPLPPTFRAACLGTTTGRQVTRERSRRVVRAIDADNTVAVGLPAGRRRHQSVSVALAALLCRRQIMSWVSAWSLTAHGLGALTRWGGRGRRLVGRRISWPDGGCCPWLDERAGRCTGRNGGD